MGSVISSAQQPSVPALQWLALCPVSCPLSVPPGWRLKSEVLFHSVCPPLPPAAGKDVRLLTTGSFSLAFTQQSGHLPLLFDGLPPFWKDMGGRGVVGGLGFHCLTATGFIWRLSWKLSCLQFCWLRSRVLSRGEALGKQEEQQVKKRLSGASDRGTSRPARQPSHLKAYLKGTWPEQASTLHRKLLFGLILVLSKCAVLKDRRLCLWLHHAISPGRTYLPYRPGPHVSP